LHDSAVIDKSHCQNLSATEAAGERAANQQMLRLERLLYWQGQYFARSAFVFPHSL